MRRRMIMAKNMLQVAGWEAEPGLPPYPIDMSPLLALWQFTLDNVGVPYLLSPSGYHPTIIAQYALVQWNQYLLTDQEDNLNTFLAQAHWLVEHETRIGNDASGWPISFPHPDVRGEGSWLSGLAQGYGLSVLVRAYQFTQQEIFLKVAERIVRTFKRDILDGGVSSPIGENGIFFEEIAVYPALHTLSGFIFALFGLYDYVALTDDVQVKELINCSLTTLHVLLDEFDIGFWTRVDLLHRHLASPTHLVLQTTLLEVLATYSGCEHCARLASRWKRYQRQVRTRLGYLVYRSFTRLGNVLPRWIRPILFPRPQVPPLLRVCVPITAFPVMGGMRTVLAKIAQVTSGVWQMEYLTQHVGPNAESFIIHQFGTRRASPWYFPLVWLYAFDGLRKLMSLMRNGTNYDVILPQDGIFTAAFAGLVGKLAGVRVVCIDHGNLVALDDPHYHIERLRALPTRPRMHSIVNRLLFKAYWPSLHLLTWLAARCVDHFCVPGVVGDGVEDILKRFGVNPSRLTRFVNAVDIRRHVILDAATKAKTREKYGIPADAVVITTICRLAPEKGLDIAIEGISNALSQLPHDLCTKVRFIMVGDGILRQKIEDDINRRNLTQTCILWGKASPEEVLLLHSLSDIYLYAGTRGGGYSLVILEAMASGCAVLASDIPLANERMLAEGRGVIVPAGDARQTGMALVRLISHSEFRCRMGQLARNYATTHNTEAIFKRVWMRATYWAELNTLLNSGIEDAEDVFL